MTVTQRGDDVSLPSAHRIRPPTGRLAWYRLAIPILGVTLGLLALVLLLPVAFRNRLFGFLALYILPGGIDYGIPIGIGMLDLPAAWVIGLVTYMDLWITLFWVWNLDHLTRFSSVDDRVHKSREKTLDLWERFPRLRVATSPGLALFIVLPIPWTGSFVGIVVGKLIGLRNVEVYLASVSGTFLRVLILTYGSALFFGLF